MKRRSYFLVQLALALVVLLAGCSRTAKHRDLYWHGELWDGMNRMVFSLQDLGWLVENVDSDNGIIEARLPLRKVGDAGSHAGEGQQAEAIKILISFPTDPESPIIINPDAKKNAPRTPEFERVVQEIEKRFIWYGGRSLEVREKKS